MGVAVQGDVVRDGQAGHEHDALTIQAEGTAGRAVAIQAGIGGDRSAVVHRAVVRGPVGSRRGVAVTGVGSEVADTTVPAASITAGRHCRAAVVLACGTLLGTSDDSAREGACGAVLRFFRCIDLVDSGFEHPRSSRWPLRFWGDLTDGFLQASIFHDENGNPIPVSNVWTGTSADGGFAGPNCSDWTALGETSRMGVVGSTTATWSSLVNEAMCNASLRLYCFEK